MRELGLAEFNTITGGIYGHNGFFSTVAEVAIQGAFIGFLIPAGRYFSIRGGIYMGVAASGLYLAAIALDKILDD